MLKLTQEGLKKNEEQNNRFTKEKMWRLTKVFISGDTVESMTEVLQIVL